MRKQPIGTHHCDPAVGEEAAAEIEALVQELTNMKEAA